MKLIEIVNAFNILKDLASNILEPKVGIKIHRITRQLKSEVKPYNDTVSDIQKEYAEFAEKTNLENGLESLKEKSPEDQEKIMILIGNLQKEKIKELDKKILDLGQEDRPFTLSVEKLNEEDLALKNFKTDNKFNFGRLDEIEAFTSL